MDRNASQLAKDGASRTARPFPPWRLWGGPVAPPFDHAAQETAMTNNSFPRIRQTCQKSSRGLTKARCVPSDESTAASPTESFPVQEPPLATPVGVGKVQFGRRGVGALRHRRTSRFAVLRAACLARPAAPQPGQRSVFSEYRVRIRSARLRDALCCLGAHIAILRNQL